MIKPPACWFNGDYGVWIWSERVDGSMRHFGGEKRQPKRGCMLRWGWLMMLDVRTSFRLAKIAVKQGKVLRGDSKERRADFRAPIP